MPSTTSSEVLQRPGFLDRDDAVLADLSMASAMIVPIAWSPLAEIMPTCATMLPETAWTSS
jgi:hypothetical protein